MSKTLFKRTLQKVSITRLWCLLLQINDVAIKEYRKPSLMVNSFLLVMGTKKLAVVSC